MTDYVALAKQVILATGGDLKRLEEAASVIEASVTVAQREQEPAAWQVKARGHDDAWLHIPTCFVENYRQDGWEVRPLYAALSSGGQLGEAGRAGVVADMGARPMSPAGVAPGPSEANAEAEMVCAEAYQAVGCMLSDLGQFDSERGQKLLDNLSRARMVHQDILPWPSFEAPSQPAAAQGDAEAEAEDGTFAGVTIKRMSLLIETVNKLNPWEMEAVAEMTKAIHLLSEPRGEAPVVVAQDAVPPKPMNFFSENVDAWGALEWFNRLASAVRQQDAAVLAGDEMAMETCRNVASSSAMRLVRDYEQQVRAALAAHTEGEPPSLKRRSEADAYYKILQTIARFPITDPKNQDAVNLQLIAKGALELSSTQSLRQEG
jgi:hypothetical protein